LKTLKTFLPLFLLIGLTTVASASPYIVYSGSVTGSSFSPAGTLKSSDSLYVLTDLSDTSNFAILDVDTANNVYTVISRPSDTPPAGEAADNFIGGVVASNGKSGQGVISFSTSVTDGSGNTFVSHAYGTGALTLRPTLLVYARYWPDVVTLSSNGVANGTYTFPAAAEISSGNVAFAKSLSGTVSHVEIGSSGALAHVSTDGTFSLTENARLTALANIGGGLTTHGDTLAIMPVAIPNGTSAADAYAAWLSAFAQANGYSLPTTSSPAIVTSGATLSMGLELSSGACTYSGSINVAGAGTVLLGDSGTLALLGTSGSSYSAQVNVMGGTLASQTSGVLYLGVPPTLGGTVPPSTGSIITVPNYLGNTGATLKLNGGSLLSLGTGTLGSGSIYTSNPPGTLSWAGSIGDILVSGGTLALVQATLSVGSVNSDSTINGTLTSLTGMTINFTNASFVNNNATSVVVPPLQAGVVIHCTSSLHGGTLSSASSVLTDTGSTLTISAVTSATGP